MCVSIQLRGTLAERLITSSANQRQDEVWLYPITPLINSIRQISRLEGINEIPSVLSSVCVCVCVYVLTRIKLSSESLSITASSVSGLKFDGFSSNFKRAINLMHS